MNINLIPSKLKHQILMTIFLLFMTGCTSIKIDDEDIDIYQEVSLDSLKKENVKKIEQDLKKFGLKTIIAFVLKNNSEIKSARYKWKSMVEKYPQAISLPDPLLTYTFFLKEPETRVGPQRQKVSVVQNIPFPRKLYLKGELVKDDAKIARLGYERVIRDVVTKTQKHFYELGYIKTALQITQKNEQLLTHLLKVASVEHATGKTSLSDVMKGQSQLAQLSYDRIRLKELEEVEIGQINALLNKHPDAILELEKFIFVDAEPLLKFETFYTYALKNNQEILASLVAITKADHKLSLAFSQYFPDFSIGGSWTKVDRTLSGFNFDFGDDGQDISAITFGLNLPIWIPKRNAQVRESKYNIKSAKEMTKNMKNQLAAELKKIYYKVSNAIRLTELYQNRLLPEAKKSVELSENWYRDTDGNLLGALESQSVWLNFSLAMARAQSDYAQGIITLSQLCGGSLPQEKYMAEEK